MLEFLDSSGFAFLKSLEILFVFILPFALPILLFYAFFYTWIRYKRTKYISNLDFVLLEIKMPREITKSPLAMEVFLTSLYQKGAMTYTDTYIDGKVRPWFSLEMVSIGGDVRFFIWTPAKWKNLIEAQIYGQYPDVEIYEVDDYTTGVKHNNKEISMWGTYFKLSEKDVYPIKSYIDYKLEGEIEEFHVDPLTAVLEYLGSMKEGEQVWIQILIQAHKKEGLREGRLFKKPNWKKEAKDEIKKLKEDLKLDDAHVRPPTEGEKQTITAIERSIDKFPFECVIRAFYIAKNESFNEISIPALIGSVRQYNSVDLNGFSLGFYTDHSDNMKDWISIGALFFPPLKKTMQKVRERWEKRMLEAYKMRSFFHPPYQNWKAKPFILTTEELATIYHFPGNVATTPTLERIGSKKAQPPSNLPI